MNKLMITTVLLASLTTVSAQKQATPAKAKPTMEQRTEERSEKQTEAMTSNLGLDKDQSTKVLGINTRFNTAMAEMRKTNLSEEERKSRSKALREQHSAELKGVLTPEQFTKLQTLEQERRVERQGEKGNDPAKLQERAADRAEKRTDAMTEDLGLNEDQTNRVQTINGTFAASVAKLKNTDQDAAGNKEQMKKLREQRDLELKGVLTAEQYTKMMEQRKAKQAEGLQRRGEMQKRDPAKKPHNE